MRHRSRNRRPLRPLAQRARRAKGLAAQGRETGAQLASTGQRKPFSNHDKRQRDR